jgi:diacylglycerol kinase (ATP)
MWLLLINPKSGNGRGNRIGKLVKQELKALGIEYIDVSADSALGSQENLKSKLKESQKFNGLFLIGGDGTVNLAVQELVGSDLGLALIPRETNQPLPLEPSFINRCWKSRRKVFRRCSQHRL